MGDRDPREVSIELTPFALLAGHSDRLDFNDGPIRASPTTSQSLGIAQVPLLQIIGSTRDFSSILVFFFPYS